MLEPTPQSIAPNLSIPPLTLGQVYQARGDIRRAIKNLKMAYQLSPSREVQTVIQALQRRDTAAVVGGDTSKMVKPR